MLAVAETLACVAAYWALFALWGEKWYHWLFLIATPMLLLRSPQSIALGVKWFERYWGEERGLSGNSKRLIVFSVVTNAILIALLFFLQEYLLSSDIGKAMFPTGIDTMAIALPIIPMFSLFALTLDSFSEVRNGAIFEVKYIILASFCSLFTLYLFWIPVYNSASISEFVIWVFFMLLLTQPILGFVLAIWVRAGLSRLLSTLRFLHVGLPHLPQNWRYNNFSSDIFHPPELVLEHKTSRFDNLRTPHLDKDIAKSERHFRHILSMSIPFLYIPTLIWRWSIKSTAWFYLPLIWAHVTWVRADGEELRVWALAYTSKLWNILSMLGTILYLAFHSIGVFRIEKWTQLQALMDSADAPLSFSLLFALDWVELAQKPWLWCYLVSAVLAVIIYFLADSLTKDIDKGGAAPDSRASAMQWLRRLSNIRAVFTSLGLFVALIYVLGAFDAWGQVKVFVNGLFAFNPPLV